ncbi:MAG: hypothetical protein IPK76_14395 [Lewinellaceae bacterium]|nr:hypothetical protein [Lewinellaceae bacterium]
MSERRCHCLPPAENLAGSGLPSSPIFPIPRFPIGTSTSADGHLVLDFSASGVQPLQRLFLQKRHKNGAVLPNLWIFTSTKQTVNFAALFSFLAFGSFVFGSNQDLEPKRRF